MFRSLLSVLLAFATACPPPLNNFKYVANDTHTTSQMIFGLPVSRNESSSLGRRWTEIVTMTGQPRMTWPGGLVQYCFEDVNARVHFVDDINAAWKLWIDKIGKAGSASGHSLQFQEYKVKHGEWPHCYNQRKKDTDPWVWNDAYPHDVAVVQESTSKSVQASSVTGYIPSGWSDLPGRHGTHLGIEFKNKYPADYWHTTHEHQRYDRGDYVHFDCSKVRGYAAAKAKVDAAKKHSMEQVCADYRLALEYDFPAIQDFDTIDHIDPHHKDGKEWPLFINNDLDFDDESIMLYTSAEFANDGADVNDVLQVPLAFWKNRGIGFNPPRKAKKEDLEIIDVRWKISDGDLEGVRHLYPYLGKDEDGQKWIEKTSLAKNGG